jgi:hypothetical protein
MVESYENLRVRTDSNGYYPQTFTWEGQLYRVLAVESTQTRGVERIFRLQTKAGPFELGHDTVTGSWRLHRKPGWLGRLLASRGYGPRYPLPAHQRRQYRPPAQRRPVDDAQLYTAEGLQLQPVEAHVMS